MEKIKKLKVLENHKKDFLKIYNETFLKNVIQSF